MTAPDAVGKALDDYRRILDWYARTNPGIDFTLEVAAREQHARDLKALEAADVVCTCADTERLDHSDDNMKATYNAITAYRAAREVRP